ncbi:MAG: class I SAM-dependent methyltransferase [Gemmatimonadales bacterium]|nr:class I SAM-dependent methyltransferase [Gemmatimonadales bacterium]
MRRFLRRIAGTVLRTIRGGGTRDLEKVFTSHYTTNHWKDAESVSGPGSTLAYTANLRRELPKLLDSLGVTSMLDAPCGDYNWFQHVRDASAVEYTGGDIVEELVRRNRARYGNASTHFVRLDITRDPLPAADLLMCRDCLFHLAEQDIFRVLDNFRHSDIRWLLTSTHSKCERNVDISSGGFRELNLQLAPFALPEPVLMIDDWVEGFPVRQMALWEKLQLVRRP